MLGTLGIINGLLTDDRQRRQAGRSLSGKPVLEWVARQMTDSCRLNGVIVLTDDSEDNAFIQMLTPLDIPVFVSKTNETLAAILQALEQYNAEACVLIGMDWPLIDPTIVDRLICSAENATCHYAAYQFECSCFAMGRPFGMFPEWYQTKTLYKAARKAFDPLHRIFPGLFFIDNKDHYDVQLLPAPTELDREDVRLTIEDEEDWEHAVQICDAMKSQDEEIDWRRITHLLHSQPELRKRMAKRNTLFSKK